VAGGVVLQERHAELEPLRPLRPPTRRVTSLHREHRRSLRRVPRAVDGSDLAAGKVEQPGNLLLQAGGSELRVDLHIWIEAEPCGAAKIETRAKARRGGSVLGRRGFVLKRREVDSRRPIYSKVVISCA